MGGDHAAEGISKMVKQELLATISERYRASSRKEKSRILDELITATGHHRKHAIRLLAQSEETREKVSRVKSRRIYDEVVLEALIPAWEAANCICGKRLEVVLPHVLTSMERHGHLDLDPEVRLRLLTASAATLDRLLKPIRATSRGPRTLGRGRHIPVRTSGNWNRHDPGFLEVRLMVHHGDPMAGFFDYSLVATDASTGWTEAVPLLTLEQPPVAEGLEAIAGQLPFPIRGINFDDDTGISETLTQYCADRGIEFTRSRAYRENDQAGIVPQHRVAIDRLIGHEHHSGQVTEQTMPYLHGERCRYMNYFQPSFRLLEKPGDGSTDVRRYGTPATPCERVLRHEAVNAEVKEILRELGADLDPVALLRTIREADYVLAARVLQKIRYAPQGESLEQFLANELDQQHHDETASEQSDRE